MYMRAVNIVRSAISKWWHEYRKSKIGVAGLVLFIIIVVVLVLAPALSTQNPYDPDNWIFELRNLPPSGTFLLGTDHFGRDLYSMLLYAGQLSLLIGLTTAVIITAFSTVVGLLAGYFGGIFDEIVMRIADVLMAIPRLPLIIVMAWVMRPGIESLIFVIAILGWTRPVRQIRALALSLRNNDYVESTRASGGSSLHIIFHHIFPNVTGIVVAMFVTETVSIILLETGLSFLGFGDPFRLTWGKILHDAQIYGAFSRNLWWWWIPTGLSITLLCLSLAWIGTTLNDRFVLKLKWRGKD